MAFTLTTRTEVQQSFGTALYRAAEPFFKAMVEGSFFTDDVPVTSGKIHITKVSKANFDKLRPLLQKSKQKIQTKGGKLVCDVSSKVIFVVVADFTKPPLLVELFNLSAIPRISPTLNIEPAAIFVSKTTVSV